jgi:hypothetical protein
MAARTPKIDALNINIGTLVWEQVAPAEIHGGADQKLDALNTKLGGPTAIWIAPAQNMTDRRQLSSDRSKKCSDRRQNSCDPTIFYTARPKKSADGPRWWRHGEKVDGPEANVE